MNKAVKFQTALLSTTLFLAATIFSPSTASSNVCAEGTGMPPFLSAGSDPNLLLVLDNSGSMLDLAYVEDVAECVDNSFDPVTTYAGLYDNFRWYWWREGVSQWRNGDIHAVGDYVYTEGVFFKATAITGLASTGAEISADTEVTWVKVYEIDVWSNGTTYAAGSFVQYEEQLYYTVAGGTANDVDFSNGVSIDDDSIVWVAVESTWLNSKHYNVGDIVSDEGMLFRAITSGTTNGTGVWDDSGVNWSRLDEGQFELIDGTNIAEVNALVAGATGTVYNGAGLYIEVASVGGVESHVPAFIASGNLLNWASSSKFDVQKKILTGGKYDPNEQHLVSQGRGCSTRGFIKEVPVIEDISGAAEVLTLSIEGADPDNWIDSTDFTTRISILGITTDGYAGSARAQACQDAIDEIAKGADASLGATKGYISDCLAYSGANNVLAESNAAYNHSTFTCWKKTQSAFTVPSDFGNVNEIINACENIYDLVPPAAIDPENSGYLCSGVYNAAVPDALLPTGSGSNRDGYVGRCWEPSTLGAGCFPVGCAPPNTPGDPRCGADGLLYDCSGNYNSNKDTCNKAWVLRQEDAAGNPCVVVGTPAQWTDDVNPNTVDECIQEALWDYCQGLAIPEVIDPTDLLFNTTETWGLVGAMVDAGIMSMFETDRPLLVMKGYVNQTIVPEGILHNVADDLRIGIMAFNENGAATECAAADPTDAIVEYCPSTNKDGAKLIAPIRSGVEVTDDKGTVTPIDDIRHIDDLTAAVNAVEATSWTPLAEAVYNAIGYYGQNTSYRLNADDFLTEAEGGPDDPVQFWCQKNNILIITEGASTADVHGDVRDLVTSIMPGLSIEDSSTAFADETECLDTDGDNLLFGSTYLDDVTYFAHDALAATMYATPAATPGQLLSDDGITHSKQNINTYVVTTGSLRDDGTTSECNPLTIMTNAASNGGTNLLSGSDPSQLENNLQSVLSDIMSRVSAGSAASVISSTRSGAGAVYQAIFWPELTDAGGNKITWTGDVHALFLDTQGRLFEDTDQDRALDTSTDVRVLFFFDQSVDPSRTRACSGTLTTPEDVNNNGILDSEDINCNGLLDAGEDLNADAILDTEDTNGNCILDFVCTGAVREIDAINYIWSVSAPNANGWLTDALLDPVTQRTWLPNDPAYPDDTMQRYVFTWNDLNNDGIVDAGEQVDFTFAALSGLAADVSRGSVMEDFDVVDAFEWERVINWVRGQDQAGMRSRLYDTSTWRLGDVIHSTPTLVGRPVEAYHFVYQDSTYALFAKRYNNRRNIVYFGANDGMLHAINAGFYVQQEKKFCLTPERDPATGDCDTAAETGKPALGSELWAYVPYNLHPHLKCLTDPLYDHKYYVDQRPRVFDVQIFEDDCTYTYDDATGELTTDCSTATYPGGWGTILVGSLRFGGAPVLAYPDLTSVASDDRKFISSYFVLDITDPENPPNLLAEMTMTVDGAGNPEFADMGYSTIVPAMDVMRDDQGRTNWYLVFGNGPTTLKGENDQQGKVAVLPLDWLNGEVDNWYNPENDDPTPDVPVNPVLQGPYRLLSHDATTKKPFRIPDALPDSATSVEGGVFQIPVCSDYDGDALPDCVESFTADMVSVDFDIENPSIPRIGAAYKTDAIYFGTTDGTGFASGFPGCGSSKCWDGTGRMYRLVTKSYDTLDADADGNFTEQIITKPWDWYLSKMIDAQSPISAAASLGWDNANFWVYFGTGRFYDRNDKPDDQTQRMFGIMEPRNCSKQQTWPTFNWWDGTPTFAPKAPDPTLASGSRGIMKVDQILVEEGIPGNLFCQDGTTNCRQDNLGNDIDTFSELKNYIAGEKDCSQANALIGLDGWYRDFPDDRERNLGQATLLGGLLTFTTYKPFEDVCKSEGESFLYGVHYQTGTAWKKNVFGTYDFMGNTIVKDRLGLGTGLALTPSLHVGTGDADATAFVQTSTGEILEIAQDELPLGNFKSGRSSWRQE